MSSIKDKIAALIDLKSIVTLELVTATTYGFIVKIVPIEVYIALVTAVITYYFTKISIAAGTTETRTETKTVSETTTPEVKPIETPTNPIT